MPIISVIVPVYSVEEYLSECLDSILAQSFTDFELILVDDGSPDGCGDICDAYAIKDKRVRVIHKKNGGLSSARNAGLDIASGEYITFIDSDDEVSNNYLDELFRISNCYNADVVSCNMIRFQNKFVVKEVNGNNDVICMKPKEAVLSLYNNNPDSLSVVAWGKLYKKRLFDSVRFPVGKIHEDQFVTPILIYKANCVIWLKKILYGYRVREGSIMYEKFSLRRFDAIDAVDHCANFFKRNSEIELYHAAEISKEILLAYYTLLARKAGIYKKLPKRYRMSRRQAINKLKRFLPYDIYSYRVAQVYPRYISIEAYLRRMFKWIGVKPSKH